VNDTSLRGPHHSDDTHGDGVILVEFVAEMVPHDSPEFQERARQAAKRPIPDYLKPAPKPDQNPSTDVTN
jgi:hypothetical protein